MSFSHRLSVSVDQFLCCVLDLLFVLFLSFFVCVFSSSTMVIYFPLLQCHVSEEHKETTSRLLGRRRRRLGAIEEPPDSARPHKHSPEGLLFELEWRGGKEAVEVRNKKKGKKERKERRKHEPLFSFLFFLFSFFSFFSLFAHVVRVDVVFAASANKRGGGKCGSERCLCSLLFSSFTNRMGSVKKPSRKPKMAQTHCKERTTDEKRGYEGGGCSHRQQEGDEEEGALQDAPGENKQIKLSRGKRRQNELH